MALTLADTANNEWVPATLKSIRHTTRWMTTNGSTYHLEPEDGNIFSHTPALVIGPAGDAKLLFHMGTWEKFYPSDDDPYQMPAGSLSDYCQHLKGQEQQQEPRAGGGTPQCKVAGLGLNVKVIYFGILSLP